MAMKRPEAAIEAWKRIETQNPQYLALVAERIFNAYKQLGRLEEGVNLLRGYLSKYPSLDMLNVVFQGMLESQGTEPAYRLARDGGPTVRYADLARDLETRGIRRPSLTDVRDSVLAIRRSKSMVLDPDDPNRRSCGSFFLNPIVDATTFARVERVVGDASMPRWPDAGGSVKLSAAWLIERAGFRRGEGPGPVMLSTRHSLAIVCREGARAADVAAFAREIKVRVEERFGVRLDPEPVLWGALSVEP